MAEEEEGVQSSTAIGSLQGSAPVTPIPPSLKFLMSSLKTLSNTPLTSENFHIWSVQVQKMFKANGFAAFLESSVLPPSQFIPNSSGLQVQNPHYTSWMMVDQNLSAALFSIISSSILPYVLTLETTAQIWQTLCKRLQATNRSRVIQLKNDLHHVSMKTNTMQTYLFEIKTLVDLLSAAGAAVDIEDVILYTLNGLPPSYQSFKTAIRTRSDPIQLDDFYALLCSEETILAAETLQHQTSATYALYATRGRGQQSGTRSRGRYHNYRGGRQSNRGRTTPSPSITCKSVANMDIPLSTAGIAPTWNIHRLQIHHSTQPS